MTDGWVTLEDNVIEGADMAERASRAATGLAALGVGPGDAVAWLLYNDAAVFTVTDAAGMLGAYAVPVNWHLAPEEVRYILADSGARALVGHPHLLAPLGALDIPVIPLSDWPDWLASHKPYAAPALDPPGSMMYTSGTTGRPKGVRRQPATPEQRDRTTAFLAEIYGLHPGMVSAVTAPLYHAAPNNHAVMTRLSGGNLVLMDRFDTERFLMLVEERRIGYAFMAPIMFVRLLKLPEAVRARYDLSSLRRVIHAGAPCAPHVKRAMIEWWGPVLVEYYGSTETGMVTWCDSAEWLARPGTVGPVMHNAEVAILGEDNRRLGPGETGDIYCLQRDLTPFTYHNDPAKRASIEHEGLVTNGDMGYLDEAGYLFLNDRRRDMIISGGVNIYPAEVEAALIDCPGVRDCAVFGVPDEEYGERVAAAIEREPGSACDEVVVGAFLTGRIAGYKHPRLVVFHDSLPREDTGKIFKRKLREPYWQGAGRRI